MKQSDKLLHHNADLYQNQLNVISFFISWLKNPFLLEHGMQINAQTHDKDTSLQVTKYTHKKVSIDQANSIYNVEINTFNILREFPKSPVAIIDKDLRQKLSMNAHLAWS